MKIKTKIQNYINDFEPVIKQVDNSTIWVLKESASKKLKQSIYDAHEGSYPNDYIYSTYLCILENLLNYDINSIDDIDDIRHELIDSMVSIYTHDLTEWLHSDISNVYYLDIAITECLCKNGFELLATAQYISIDEVFEYVLELLRD